MKARPILFSGPMVCALLDGRKTQTRRLVRYLSGHKWERSQLASPQSGSLIYMDGAAWDAEIATQDWGSKKPISESPYGIAGDLLWVRETWSPSAEPENHEHARLGFTYRADWSDEDDDLREFPWKPCIFMPRSASRLTLEITVVRVERLQDISESDAYAEGVTIPSHQAFVSNGNPELRNEARCAYSALWNSINGPSSWSANPFVWVLDFKVHYCNLDEMLKRRAA